MRRPRAACGVAAVAAVLGAALSSAQAPGRIATTVDALRAYAVFFHGRQIVVRASVETSGRLATLKGAQPPSEASGSNPIRPVYVIWKENPGSSTGEIRGEFWDLGRLREDDARFASYDFHPILEAANGGHWPGRDEIFVVLNATLIDTAIPPGPTVRAIALAPEHYANRAVTVAGRFRGRNLYGDLPAPLNRSRWDFVLQSADGAVWVSAIRPRGKGFDLDPGARVDTGRWVEVSGTVRTDRASVWVEGDSIELSSAPTDTAVDIVVAPPKEPPPQVIFSAPVPDEVDVEVASQIRIQFSRDMDGRTFRDRVRIAYTAGAQGPPPAAPAFTATYREGNRALEIKFAKPLERFRQVRVDLLEGITATDGQALAPWALVFTTGG